ncbi:Potassium transporter 1 [Arabidopsis thaliana]|uniref:Potassium transporter 1 n=5 Tax=Arabidopsis TaxID=3701 RepID=POT1_ARATH|nr:potassium transporter 1 [Arabidopsis thaliana]O22397.2 RecName: Full=Potassium transporter 1; Short=AtKT1; Short=AtKUP1; Short=AtPOT1 [Arabidopsis thaliana]KAG7637930.1 Potassium transporter [Arabidopsis thaliana x Arabidopsis arenosa]AAB87687.1 potassium transporter [Arabidopsis thaliana]AAB88901.1 high-affinity potassium transporter [Arabidopsis thaliana]AAC16965.1 high affinity K+ transporter (AtKUP1/AtKT1p) [Arabidopsis thaliana]AAM14984.1 high affinity K+ transporter (AtKUP1 AtKT1p) [|eukprot:NP_180568.1 potassium transporter 1 [Arabidopsis thaliana]
MNQSPSLIEQGISQQHLKTLSCANVLTLAYQSLGVIYGDLSTSPLYVYKTTFSGKLSLHEDDEEIFGVFSFIFWTFTLIALFKYVFIVLSADDNGEGGTFALYSLLCRYAKLSILPNHQEMDEKLSTYATGSPGETRQSAAVKSFFEKHPKSQKCLLLFVLLGTCMAIGDSVLTPTISVLSAVSGVKLKIPNLHENYVVIIACIILVAIFSVQRYGTHRVAFIFAPISTAWLLSISSIGVYNTIKWNPRIVSALSPVYMYKFLRSTGVEGWVSLGGVVLSITGVETMFADLGHFSSLSIKVAFSFFVYPCLILAYMGEAAFLSKHHEDIQQSFYKAIPEPVFWPVFIVATFAAVVGSQAVISATFSIISQCCALDCFPRVKIIHTSSKIHGQIYIPEVNWMLMCLCLAVTIGLRDTNMMGHAYGLAVTSVMLVTTCLMTLVMTIVWKQRIITVLAFVVFFGSIELLYFSSCVYKVPEGGWIPILLSLTFMAVMYIWNYGTTKKHEFDVENKVSMDRIVSLGPSIGMVRVPGIGLVYSNLVTGVPAVFGHFVTNLPAFHKILVFVCVKSVQVPYVGEEERFVISRVGPKEYGMFRSVVRYGYRDVPREMYDFESRLVSAIVEFVETEPGLEEEEMSSVRRKKEECMEIMEAKEAGVAYILGHSYAKAKQSSSVLKKLAVNVVFAFMSTNCRGTDVVLNVPHTSLLEVGMVYYV